MTITKTMILITLVFQSFTATASGAEKKSKKTATPNKASSVHRTTAQANEDIESQLKKIRLEKGFSISLYAKVPGARSMALSPNGTLFVGTGGLGGQFRRVYAVNKSKVVTIIQDDLETPNGVAFKDGDLYVAELTRILRYKNIEEFLKNSTGKKSPPYEVFYDGLPSESSHGWKFIRFAPDGSLIVPQGAPCNICTVDDRHGGIYKISADGKTFSTIAKGVRNSVGFDFHPVTGDMIFTDNGRDSLGEDIPPCELNRIPEKYWKKSEPLHYGFPHCHAGKVIDPVYHQNHSCEEFTAPILNLGAHVAPLGPRFYTGKMFPTEYKNQIFIAEHGSWNRTVPQGYRVSMAWTMDNGKTFTYKIFAEGWLDSNGDRWGRPVDLEVMQDGSLLISDDMAGAIYQVSYKAPVRN